MSFILTAIWREFDIKPSKELWILRKVLRISDKVYTNKEPDLHRVIFRAFNWFKFGPLDEPYLRRYNSGRADLIASWIDPPKDLAPDDTITFDLEPSGDLSYWLASYLLGYTDQELCALCQLSPTQVKDPGSGLLKLLRVTYRHLGKIVLKDDYLHAYHRARYLFLKYHLDATYHVLN